MAVRKSQKYIFILLAILALASFFRLWQLDTIPPGLYPDEAINANEAASNPGKLFYPENNGREGLFINLIAGSFSIFGISIWSIRIVPAIIGILTVLGLYLLTKELFWQWSEKRSRWIALLASFFLATSFWHINFSRIGFRAILVPLILVFSLYFLFKGFRQRKTWNLIISGIIFGLGFYTYIAFRLSVLLLVIVLFLWWLIYKKQNLQKKFLVFTLWFLLFTFITALPIGIYFLENPQDFISRASGISIFAQANPLKAFGQSLVLHLGMFNFQGDHNWRHNISGSPVLFWPIGILFLIGLICSIFNLVRGIKRKKFQNLTIFGFLIGWWLIMLLPGILTAEGVPHSLRCIGAIPPAFIFGALGFEFLYQKLKGKIQISSFNKLLIIFVLILLTFSFIFAQYSRYFILWAKNPEVENAFSKNYVEIGNYLNSLPPGVQKYVIVNQSGTPVPEPDGIPMPAQTIMFIERTEFGNPQAIYLLPKDLDQIKIENKKTVILPMQYDENLILELRQKFPQGEIQEKDGVWIYQIKP